MRTNPNAHAASESNKVPHDHMFSIATRYDGRVTNAAAVNGYKSVFSLSKLSECASPALSSLSVSADQCESCKSCRNTQHQTV